MGIPLQTCAAVTSSATNKNLEQFSAGGSSDNCLLITS